MLKLWTGEIVGLMHTYGITASQLAEELGVTDRYLSAILNCHKEPRGIEERTRAALQRLIDAEIEFLKSAKS